MILLWAAICYPNCISTMYSTHLYSVYIYMVLVLILSLYICNTLFESSCYKTISMSMMCVGTKIHYSTYMLSHRFCKICSRYCLFEGEMKLMCKSAFCLFTIQDDVCLTVKFNYIYNDDPKA